MESRHNCGHPAGAGKSVSLSWPEDTARGRAVAVAEALTHLGVDAIGTRDGDVVMSAGDAELIEYLLRWAQARGAVLTREWCGLEDES